MVAGVFLKKIKKTSKPATNRESKGGTGEKRGPLVLSCPPSRSFTIINNYETY